MDQVVTILDIIGVFFFAISGSLTAMSKKLDPFGVFIVAFVASVGGGTLRDILIGRNPVFWMTHSVYIYVIISAVFFAIVFRKKIGFLRTTLSIFDTIGLAVFTIIGIKVGQFYELNDIVIISVGVMTGTFGGVIRDTLVNEIPIVFHKEIYASASVLGGIVYLFGTYLEVNIVWNQVISIFVIIIVRTIAVRYKLALPSFYHIENDVNEKW